MTACLNVAEIQSKINTANEKYRINVILVLDGLKSLNIIGYQDQMLRPTWFFTKICLMWQ